METETVNLLCELQREMEGNIKEGFTLLFKVHDLVCLLEDAENKAMEIKRIVQDIKGLTADADT